MQNNASYINITAYLSFFADRKNICFKCFAFFCPVLHAVAVCVYGVERQPQELGQPCAVGDAESHEGDDTQLGRKPAAGSGGDLPVGQQERVEITYEVGKNVENSCIEHVEEAFGLILHHLARFDHLVEILSLIDLELAAHQTVEFLKPVEIYRTQIEQLLDVHVARND